MSAPSEFAAGAALEGFFGHERLLSRIAGGSARDEWLAELAAYARRQGDFFAQLINMCPFGVYVVDAEFRIVAMNERSQTGAFLNIRPIIGRAFDEVMNILWPEPVALEIIGQFRRTLETGEPYHSRDFVAPRADTDEIEGYEWELHRTVLAEGGCGVICYYFDSTELRQVQRELAESAKRQELLIDELNHRVKNMLMIVQSLAQQTFGRDLPAEKRLAFEGRLGALSQAHDTLTRTNWERAELSQVIAGSIEACGVSSQIATHGPPVWLESRTAVSMAMAIHELCTNALKYGALSVASGHVDVGWTVSPGDSPELWLRWHETGGPPVHKPARYGFGTRMLGRALAGELKAQVDLAFDPGGLICTIRAQNGALFHLDKGPAA